ncbi:Trafficking protein particle complex subunit 9 [Hondaea fermentalgiana]|uniref:Trafficking protein particle complex subunit 9 n=1 Tax=Hondaea fermentalgiana TaxID=2315210 RepID=A0A2R5GFQ8_9STRA|nr:Trafficking protein particle complex subunit 9 [Hondaea fermentalgiana]|eukprot:GBG29742.1 Trafficking protein particle complex subunit 9 [Hondaea fermentalgiana]
MRFDARTDSEEPIWITMVQHLCWASDEVFREVTELIEFGASAELLKLTLEELQLQKFATVNTTARGTAGGAAPGGEAGKGGSTSPSQGTGARGNNTAQADVENLDLGVKLAPGSVLGQNLVRHACIRVLVVPVGPISVSKFGSYFATLCRFTKLSTRLVTPYAGSRESDALAWRSWQDGVLRFKFVVQGAADDDAGQSLGELGWHNLQPHRRVSAVIGICDWPKVTNIDAALEEFEAAVRQYPQGTLSRWCAFNMTDSQSLDQDALAALLGRGMEIFDAEKTYEDGSSNYDLRMEMILCNLSTTLLEKYDKIISEGRAMVTHVENKSKPLPQLTATNATVESDSFLNMVMHGTTYPGDDAVSHRLNDQKTRARMAGRIRAWIAGYALLAGSPQDALELHNAAIRSCASAADAIWHAVALEGSASALYLARLFPDEEPRFLSDVAEALRKASALYAKHPHFWPLESDVALKLAAYSPADSVKVLASLSSKAAIQLRNAQTKSIVHKKRSRDPESASSNGSNGPRSFGKAIASARSGNGAGAGAGIGSTPSSRDNSFSSERNLESELEDEEVAMRAASLLFRDVCLQSAMIFEHRGYPRKASFMLQQAAAHEYDWTDGLVLYQLAGERLGILPRFSIGNDDSDVLEGADLSEQKKKSLACDHVAWVALKRTMLQILVDAAQNAGRGQLAIDYTLQLLQLLQNNHDKANQTELSEVILSCVGSGGFTYLHKPCPFPAIEAMVLIDAAPPLELHKRTRRRGSSAAPAPASLFYSPFAAQSNQGTKLDKTWPQNEIFSVLVTLSNPMAFPVRVDSISLDVDPKDNVECHRASLRLRPHEKGHRVSLSARPLACGQYSIRGCNVSALGLKSHHAIADSFNVLIVPVMPCLAFEHLTHRQSVALRSPTELFEGELLPIECEMHGTSGVHITDIELTASVAFEAPNAEIYRRNLVPETYASSSATSLLDLFAFEDSEARDSDASSEFSSASSAADYLITSSSKLLSQRPKVNRVVLQLEETNRKLQSALESLNGELSAPQRFQLVLRACRGCKNASVEITYSAADLDFERRYAMSFDLHVQPSMQVISIDILPDPVRANDRSSFLVLLDVKNDASQSFELRAVATDEASTSWTKSRGASPAQVQAGPFSVHRLAIRVEKESDRPIEDVLAWVDEKVRVEWIMSTDPSRKGRVVLATAVLAPAAADRLNSGLLALSVSQTKGASEISITVQNRSKTEVLRDLSVSLYVRPGPVSEHLLWDGALSVLIPKVPPQGEQVNVVTYSMLLKADQVLGDDHLDVLEVVLLAVESSGAQRVWSTSASFSLADLLRDG